MRGTIMRVRLLGPVDIVVDGEERPVAGLRRKAVLATLALHVGEVVSTDRLVDAVWGETAPLTALNTLQHHVSHLRAILGGRARSLPIPARGLRSCGRRLPCGGDGPWPTWPGWPGWRARPDGWTCSASRSGARCPRRGWRRGSICIWCPSWNRWWPITRWMSRFTRSS